MQIARLPERHVDCPPVPCRLCRKGDRVQRRQVEAAGAAVDMGGVCLASSDDRLVRMTAVAASVAAPNIVDHRLRFLMLHLERRDQRALRRNGHALALTRDVYSNREFERHAPISSEGSLVTIRPPAGALITG